MEDFQQDLNMVISPLYTRISLATIFKKRAQRDQDQEKVNNHQPNER